ncbi:MAG: hypothetical protein ACRDY6_16035, partial [Acidimicrobiia bacterium]
EGAWGIRRVAVAPAVRREDVEAHRQGVEVRCKRSGIDRRGVKENQRLALTMIVVPGAKTFQFNIGRHVTVTLL